MATNKSYKKKSGYKGRYRDMNGSKNFKPKKNSPMVAVGMGKTWFFKSKDEASKIMGISVMQISKEMKNNGKNASNLKWYTRDFYDKKIANKDKKPSKQKPNVDEFGYVTDEWGIKRNKAGDKVPDLDPIRDRDEIADSLKRLERMASSAERTILRNEMRNKNGKSKSK